MKNKKRKKRNPIQISTQLTYRHLTTPTKKGKLEKEHRRLKNKGWQDC